MKKYLLLLLFIGINRANAQSVFGVDKSANADNIVFAASLSVNSSGPLVYKQFGGSYSAKGALSVIPLLGIYYHKSIGNRLSVRFGFGWGYSSNPFKYTTFDSISPNYNLYKSKESTATYTKATTGTGFILPQLDFGYIFGPFKEMYLIEVRAGVGMQLYLGHNNDSIVTTSGSDQGFNYYIQQSANYGRPNAFGSILANFYAGFRWQKTTNEFLNHFSIGVQATLPVSNNYAGSELLEYKDQNDQVFSREQVYLSQFSFGIKAAYNIL